MEKALAFLNEEGKIISIDISNSIEFFDEPDQSISQMTDENGVKILFHSAFNPEIIRVDNGKIEPYSGIQYEGELVEKPTNTDFVKDQEGLNQYRESLINQPSFFTIFEITIDQYILVHFLQIPLDLLYPLVVRAVHIGSKI